MEMEVIPGRIRCLDCDCEFPAGEDGFRCPECGSDKIKPSGGTEFIIKDIYGD
nr:hydrogenase maturation nickel metallochaperone HypA [uncultured Schaedlerella sp.]